ncbi:Maf family protein [Citricoccus sp. GCM10030269]|uniref:Maf family protein n=1 Tax=Citricoccus sp. GCM10030269 TaxID=3273388 RepID=UPI00360CB567
MSVGGAAADRADHVGSPAPRLILASASPARARLLSAAGITFEVIVSDVDEDAVTAARPEAGPAETAQLLARAKCEDVARRPEAAGALVLGCDSVFELDGVAYGKPWKPDVARERWRLQSGRTGQLHTGHWLVDARSGETAPPAAGALATASVTFAEVTDEEIADYVATGEPLECAGAFTIDGRGAALISAVNGDPNAVIGLSVSTLRGLMTEFGTSLTSFWPRG